MDRPKQTTWATGWIEYAEWLEAENAILQNNNEALNKDDKTLKDHIELLESDGDKLREALESMAMAALDNGAETVTDNDYRPLPTEGRDEKRYEDARMLAEDIRWKSGWKL
jgi:hypothetical protein